MVEMPDAWLPVMNALLDAPVAWRTPAQLAAAIGRGVDETNDLLCDLELAGWLVVWDAEPGPLVTLSPLAAARWGVRLVETGPGETPRWARAFDPDPPLPRAKHVCAHERAASLAFVVDPAPAPDLAAERSERAEALARSPDAADAAARSARPEFLPRPSILIGLGLSPWPGPFAAPFALCPVCGGRTLPPQMYCLYCDRWGLDGLPAADSLAVCPNPQRVRSDRSEPDRLEADRLRARRKAKRAKRHQARIESERRPIEQARPPSPSPPSASRPATDFTRPPRGQVPFLRPDPRGHPPVGL